jgi:hypothetical protein
LNRGVQEIENRENGWLAVLGTLAAVLAISLLSGYRAPGASSAGVSAAGMSAAGTPFQVLWTFSPLGLITSALSPAGLPYSWLPARKFTFGPAALSCGYLVIFLKTCLLEAPFYYWALRGARRRAASRVGHPVEHPGAGFRRWPVIAQLGLANLLTHPVVFFVIPALFSRYLTGLLVAEVFAPVVEGVYCAWVVSDKGADKGKGKDDNLTEKQGWRQARAFVIAVLANLFSWQVGVFL